MWKIVVAASLAGLIASLGILFDTNLRYGAAIRDPHAQIEDVQRGSPADRAGLLRGDIVLAVDGVDVPMTDLRRRITCGCAAFRERVITVDRNGTVMAFRMTPEHRLIGIHFAEAKRYVPNLYLAARQAYRAWQLQAYAPAKLLAESSQSCVFGQRHVMSMHSVPHKNAAIMSLTLFWVSLFSLAGAFGFALRRRRAAA